MTHKLGLIGFGGMAAGYHFENAKREDVPFEVTAVFDLREERRNLAKEKGVAVFDNLKDFLDSRLFEMVIVATPNNTHCPMACAAMEAGYHVMTEKPAAMTSVEIERMIETSKRTGKLYTVHQNRRWDRDFLVVKHALEEGLVGTPRVIESRVQSAQDSGSGVGMQGWRGFPDHGGGMLMDWGVHILDQILYLIDEPIVSVSANMLSLFDSPVDDYTKLVITFASGLIAHIEVSTYTLLQLPRWYIIGDAGYLTMDTKDYSHVNIRHIGQCHEQTHTDVPAYTMNKVSERQQTTLVLDNIDTLVYPEPEKIPPQDWASLYKNLAGVLEGTEELVVKPEQVLRCFKVIEAAFQSSKEHRTILF